MRWGWGILLILVTGAVFVINPNIKSPYMGDSRKQFLNAPPIPLPHFFHEAQISEKPRVILYRENLQRTGISHTQDIHPMARPSWRLSDFNIENHGASKSSPITDGEGVYLGSDRGVFSKVDARTGKVVWNFSTSAPQGIHGSAVIVDNNVYWGDYEGILYCADKNTGKINWLIDLGDTIGASPLYHDGAILVSVETFRRANGFLAKVDARTGQVIWLSEYFGSHPHSSPALSEDLKTVYVGANSNLFFSIDFSSGKTNWKFPVEGPIKGTPAVWEGDIYFCSWDSNLYRLNAKGETIWKTFLNEGCQSSATFSKKFNQIYIITNGGVIFALDITSGEIKWHHSGSGKFMSSPVLVIDSKTKNETLYGNCFSNSLCQFSPQDGKILRTFKFQSRLTAVPLIKEGQMYISLDGLGGLIKWY